MAIGHEEDELTPDQAKALEQERFIAEVLKIRKGEEPGPKSKWMQFLDSAGGVALVTVVLGTAGAGVLNSCVQEKLKEREAAAAQYQERVKQQQQVTVQASEVIADSISTSEDLAELWADAFNPHPFKGEQHARIINYRNDVRTKYNTADSQWRVQSIKIALTVSLFDDAEGHLETAWNTVRNAVSAYTECVEDWNYEHTKSQKYVTYQTARNVCKDKRDIITTDLDAFARATGKAWRAGSAAHAAAQP